MRFALPTCALVLLSACSQHAPQLSSEEQVPAFNEARFRLDIQTLSSDKFEGRAPTTQGEALTLDYLSKAFAAAGLVGANDGSFLQPVPMVSYTASESQTVTLGDLPMHYRQDIVLGSRHDNQGVEIKDAPLVFVGYGIKAPEYHWDDYQGLDMKDRKSVV